MKWGSDQIIGRVVIPSNEFPFDESYCKDRYYYRLCKAGVNHFTFLKWSKPGARGEEVPSQVMRDSPVKPANDELVPEDDEL